MDRYPKKTKDSVTNEAFDFIFQNAFGNPIVFSSVPTLAQMKANSWGKYSTNIYIKYADNTGVVIAGTALT